MDDFGRCVALAILNPRALFRDVVFNGSIRGLGPCRVGSSPVVPTNDEDTW